MLVKNRFRGDLTVLLLQISMKFIYLSSFAVLFRREKVPRVPETLLKKRKSLEQLKAARAKAQLVQKKVGQ